MRAGPHAALPLRSYEDDRDEGEWFLYTGSGGRDLSGNKRTNKEQSFDQVCCAGSGAMPPSVRACSGRRWGGGMSSGQLRQKAHRSAPISLRRVHEDQTMATRPWVCTCPCAAAGV